MVEAKPQDRRRPSPSQHRLISHRGSRGRPPGSVPDSSVRRNPSRTARRSRRSRFQEQEGKQRQSRRDSVEMVRISLLPVFLGQPRSSPHSNQRDPHSLDGQDAPISIESRMEVPPKAPLVRIVPPRAAASQVGTGATHRSFAGPPSFWSVRSRTEVLQRWICVSE